MSWLFVRGNWWILALLVLAIMTLVNGAAPAQQPEIRKLPPVVIDLSQFGLGYATAEVEHQ